MRERLNHEKYKIRSTSTPIRGLAQRKSACFGNKRPRFRNSHPRPFMTCKRPSKCWCKTCRKKYDAARFRRTRIQRNLQLKDRRAKRLLWLHILKHKPCTDCGKKYHPAAMQFDHISPDKEAVISELVSQGYGKHRILKEVAKCELVCENCHAVRTYNRTRGGAAVARPFHIPKVVGSNPTRATN